MQETMILTWDRIEEKPSDGQWAAALVPKWALEIGMQLKKKKEGGMFHGLDSILQTGRTNLKTA